MKNAEKSVGEATCIVYTHTFNNGNKYFGNGTSSNRAYENRGRGPKYVEQLSQDSQPQVQITATDLTPIEADTLEQKLFDDYVGSGGLALQRRPSGIDLQRNISRSNSDAYKLAMASPEYSASVSASLIGNSNGRTAQRKVISMLDGKITNHACSSGWNKKNPEYIGTWVDL